MRISQIEELCTPGARRTDPDTSHAAAAQAKDLQANHNSAILLALDAYGAAGKDAIGWLTNLSGTAVARRLTELQRAGLVRLTGRTVRSDSGRFEREWATVKRY